MFAWCVRLLFGVCVGFGVLLFGLFRVSVLVVEIAASWCGFGFVGFGVHGGWMEVGDVQGFCGFRLWLLTAFAVSSRHRLFFISGMRLASIS